MRTGPLVLLAAVAGFTVGPAAAQVELPRYHPLAVGDVRVYSVEESSTTTSGSCPAYESSGYLREDVLRDTTVGGTPFRVVRTTRTNAEGDPVGTSLYAARVLDTGGLEVIAVHPGGGGALVLPDAPSASGIQTVPATTIISGTAYPVAGTHGFGSSGTGSGGSFQNRSERFAADIGPLENRRQNGRTFPPLSCSQSRSLLVYAVVAGVTYGQNPVAGEGGPAGGPTFTVRAFPSPARRSVTVEVGEVAAVDVFDALGRRVASGEAALGQPLRLDVAAWPPGVYVARTAGESRRGVVRFVVVR